MTPTRLSCVLLSAALCAALATGCGGGTPIAPDAGAGHAGAGGDGAGGGAGQGGAGGGVAGTGGGQPPCDALPEAACGATSGCRYTRCTCDGRTIWSACIPTSGYAVDCFCPSPAPACATLGETACEARADCHSVFEDPGTCACAGAGCCAKFSVCADGDKAACAGTPLCKIAAPSCEGPYVVAYTATCYEGCVKETDCAP